ncbi:hypothetical protein [Celeribacter indicus]|uniref:hypothetical protein n=1 Tax=Celeribacter indicus TaxID=1208324 RepID=UPI000894AFE0|nr:hypothetical protein [Celeribacter indicus]SDW00031.1 hypothetical protein SAMN05443573_1013 [Celeribacter indicus]
MTTFALTPPYSRSGNKLLAMRAARRRIGVRVVSEEALEDALEDARLNAIADERAGGPFVSVSLDDL